MVTDMKRFSSNSVQSGIDYVRSIVRFMLFWGVLLTCSCNRLDVVGMFYTESAGSDERFAQSQEYNSTHGFDTVLVAQDNYRVYIMTDIHVDNTTINLDTFTSAYLEDADAAPFCLCLGDLINGKGYHPKFLAYVDRIRAAGRQVYCTPGNHDIYFGQWNVYRDYWHTSSYYFVVQTPSGLQDMYICLDSSNGTLGAAQRAWLEKVLQEAGTAGYRHIVCFTHTHLWKKDQSQGHTSNFALEETYDLADLFSRYGVELVLQGHSHHRNLTRFKNVLYLRLDKMQDHYYNSFYTILTAGTDFSWQYVAVGPQHEGYNEVKIEGR